MGLLLAVTPDSMDASLKVYSKAYNTAFDRLKGVELSDTQTRIQKLGPKGKTFQPQLDELRKRQGEVSDLLVKAVELRKKGEAERRAATVDEGTKVLVTADTKSQALLTDLAQFNQKLTEAGAPIIDPGPPRDPNARD